MRLTACMVPFICLSALLVGFLLADTIVVSTRSIEDVEAKALFGGVCDIDDSTEKNNYCGNEDGEDCNGDTCSQQKMLIQSGSAKFASGSKICSNYECCDSYPTGPTKCKGS